MTTFSSLSKKNIVALLIIMVLCSVGFKLYLIDFSVPETGDSWIYILRAIANSQGNYSETPEKTQGWNLFLSPFFLLIDSDNYLDYVNIARIGSIILSTITIVPMYLLARKYFNEKYSLLAASFIAFQPQLHYNASLGFSEPLFLLILTSSLVLLINNKVNYNVFISAVLLGIIFWSRFFGLLLVIPFTISYFILYRNTKNKIQNFLICSALFILTISPILILRTIEFGNPLYYWNPIQYNLFPGIGILQIVGIVALPYLIFLFPIGMYYSIKQKKMTVIWIFLLATLIPFSLTTSLTNEARHLFHLYPFLILFATLGIKELVKVLQPKKTNLIIVTTLGFVLLTSGYVTSQVYGQPDALKIQEIQEYSQFLINNIDGKLYWSKGVDSDWVWVTMINESNGDFKNYRINPDFNILFSEVTPLTETNLYVLSTQELDGLSLDDIISKGKQLNLRYFSVGNENDHKFFDDVYNNEENYEYLDKIFDSDEHGFQKYKVKTFEINYEKFDFFKKN